jgi:isoleucyl-tRNA synthetase
MSLHLVQEEPGYGADVLRLWVSSVDYTGDVLIGPQILRQMSDMYRKLRGTMRFLISNLHDWKVSSGGQLYVFIRFSDKREMYRQTTYLLTYFN